MECSLVRIQENTDQKKLRIWTLFTQCEDVKEMLKNTLFWKIVWKSYIIECEFSEVTGYHTLAQALNINK